MRSTLYVWLLLVGLHGVSISGCVLGAVVEASSSAPQLHFKTPQRDL